MADDLATREIAQMRQDIRDDLVDLKEMVAKRVSQEVYDLKHEALVQRVAAMEVARERDAERLRSTVRWVLGVVIIPVVIGIIQIVTSLRGSS